MYSLKNALRSPGLGLRVGRRSRSQTSPQPRQLGAGRVPAAASILPIQKKNGEPGSRHLRPPVGLHCRRAASVGSTGGEGHGTVAVVGRISVGRQWMRGNEGEKEHICRWGVARWRDSVQKQYKVDEQGEESLRATPLHPHSPTTSAHQQDRNRIAKSYVQKQSRT